MKIKFNSNDELPLNKTIKIPSITIAVRVIFYENNKYYHKFSLMNVCIKYKNGKVKIN